MKVLLFVGAGVSAELGVPPMREMVEELRRHLSEHRFDSALLGKLDQQLASSSYDIEQLIEDLDAAERASGTFSRWGSPTDEPLVRAMKSVLDEAEWLVSHVCERVDTLSATRLWSPALRAMTEHDSTIATTNYDRAIELSCGDSEIDFQDGFASSGSSEYVKWQGLERSNTLDLLKLHGSTDWYHGEDFQLWKLRHAMPLFGALRVSVAGEEQLVLKSAAVLPSREKRLTLSPYPQLSQHFRNRADAADFVMFVGTSLRDPDLRDVAARCASRVPTWIVSRSGNPQIPGADNIRQSPSRFLLSSLPWVLRRGLNAASEITEVSTGSLLADLMMAHDTDAPVPTRTSAIESLATARAHLSLESLEPLLRDPVDEVRTFALALVADSLEREDAMAIAAEVALDQPDSVAASELGLLKDLLAAT